MIKMIALVKKRPDLTHAAFQTYWLNVHTALSTRIPGIREYRINVALEHRAPDAAPYDGTAELWWDSLEAMQHGLASVENTVAGPDTHNFASEVTFLVTEEHIIIQGELHGYGIRTVDSSHL